MHRFPRSAVACGAALLAASLLSPVHAQQNTTRGPAPQAPRQATDGVEDYDRVLFDTDELWDQLSSAFQAQLVRKFGPRKRSAATAPYETGNTTLSRQTASVDKVADIANALVNDPASDTTSHDTQSETAITVAGSNVIVGFNDSGSNASGASHFTGYSVSIDGGATFTDKGVLPTGTGGDAGDPVLARDNTTGMIYLATLAFDTNDNLQFWRSSDNGQTFTGPINSTPGFVRADSMDKEWITVDNFPGEGQGNIYQAWRNFSNNAARAGITFTRSTDGGATWGPANPAVFIATGGQGSWVTVGPDHAVYVFWLDGHNIRMRKSTNLGVSFGPIVTVAALSSSTGTNGDLGLGGNFRTNTFPQVVVNPVNGNLYLVVADRGATAPDKADIFFTQSIDGGSTWSALTRLNDDATTNDQWQPALAVSPDGSRVFVGYYSRELDGTNVMIDNYARIGTVSGTTVTFGPSMRLTTTSYPVVVGVDSSIVGTYMGDYDSATADASAFYYTWGDNRDRNNNNTRNQANVRFARVPFNTGGGTDTVGVYASTGSNYFLRNSNTPGPADIVASFGASGSTPIVGDWDGNGTTTIGQYVPGTGTFFLRNSNSPGAADLAFSFGPGGSFLPVVGDWDGNGTVTVGLYDPTTGTFFLRNSNSPGGADLVFSFGAGGIGLVPLVGDWNGDGVDTVGAYDPTTGAFFLRNANSPGGADIVATFGAGGFIPLSGDWNGDGTDTFGLYDVSTGNFFLRNSNTPGGGDIIVGFGAPNLVPLVGNWDGQ